MKRLLTLMIVSTFALGCKAAPVLPEELQPADITQMDQMRYDLMELRMSVLMQRQHFTQLVHEWNAILSDINRRLADLERMLAPNDPMDDEY